MTINILEKVGEITITELRSAKENNRIAIKEQERLAELKRLEEERKERERQEQIARFLPKLADEINKAAEEGATFIELLWEEEKANPCEIDFRVLEKVFESVKTIFKNLGYSMLLHSYSQSWVTRSGKLGFLNISWSNISEK